jgi:hypothetical protein
VIRPDTTLHVSRRGSSHHVYRIENPEPGEWTLRIRGQRRAGSAAGSLAGHVYTWGVHGETPLGIRVTAPRPRQGAKRVSFRARLADPQKVARTRRLSGVTAVPAASVADLVRKHARALATLDLRFEPDTPKTDPALTKLGLLDLRTVATGKPSLFRTRAGRVTFSGPTARTAYVDTPVAGPTGVRLSAVGTTRAGYPFARLARFDVAV